MDIDFAILADAAQLSNQKVSLLGGGWTAIWTRELPAVHRSSLAVGIRVLWVETNERHALEIDVRDADGNLVQEIARGEFEAGRPPGIVPGSDQLVNLVSIVEFKLEELGAYEVRIAIDGEVRKRLSYHVVQIPPGTQVIG